MFGHEVQRAIWISGGLTMLLLVVAFAGCAAQERDRHPHQNVTVATSAACRVCPDVGPSPPLESLGGYHVTRWHSIEPTMMRSGDAGVFPRSPALLPHEEVPIPAPAAGGSESEMEDGDSVRPDILPGIHSSTSPTRDSWLTQTAWPAAVSSKARGVVRLPTVVEQGWQEPRNRIVR